MTRKYLLYQLLALFLLAALYVFLSSNKRGQMEPKPSKQVIYCGGVRSIQVKLSAPKPISPENHSHMIGNTVQLVWSKEGDSCQYILKVCGDSLFIDSKEYATKDTSFLFSSIGNQLYWKVKAKAKNGSESQWSKWSHVSFSPPVIPNLRSCNGNCGSCTHRCGRRPDPTLNDK